MSPRVLCESEKRVSAPVHSVILQPRASPGSGAGQPRAVCRRAAVWAVAPADWGGAGLLGVFLFPLLPGELQTLLLVG